MFPNPQGNTGWQDHDGRNKQGSRSWNHEGNGNTRHDIEENGHGPHRQPIHKGRILIKGQDVHGPNEEESQDKHHSSNDKERNHLLPTDSHNGSK